jgi:hypothetical protein
MGGVFQKLVLEEGFSLIFTAFNAGIAKLFPCRAL